MGYRRAHLVGVDRRPPTAARWAEAAPLAREGHEEISSAGEAVEATESVGQDTAGQVAAQLALDVAREAAVTCVRVRASQEGLQVLEEGGTKGSGGSVAWTVLSGLLRRDACHP
jgi:hypothetical protein